MRSTGQRAGNERLICLFGQSLENSPPSLPPLKATTYRLFRWLEDNDGTW